MNQTVLKYLLRFGIPMLIIIGLISIIRFDAVLTMLYKCCLIFMGFTVAEIIWVVGYKYIFGKIEQEGMSEESKRSVLMFRGMLYAAVIIGLTLGL